MKVGVMIDGGVDDGEGHGNGGDGSDRDGGGNNRSWNSEQGEMGSLWPIQLGWWGPRGQPYQSDEVLSTNQSRVTGSYDEFYWGETDIKLSIFSKSRSPYQGQCTSLRPKLGRVEFNSPTWSITIGMGSHFMSQW